MDDKQNTTNSYCKLLTFDTHVSYVNIYQDNVGDVFSSEHFLKRKWTDVLITELFLDISEFPTRCWWPDIFETLCSGTFLNVACQLQDF